MLKDVLKQYWGYDGFRPLQERAMEAVLAGEDSLVVLPTGGGKSLCFQAPAMMMEGLALVVSPLISLMKDQVDALRACGIAAACINSTLSTEERNEVKCQVENGSLKLLYIAPERLLINRTLEFLAHTKVTFAAIDEAHCISAWGHDFRPEYRGLRVLKELFPGIGVHAYTATASKNVQEDIIEQLALTNPNQLIGSFDRPNLKYQVRRGIDKLGQIQELIQRRAGESGIVYCISRKEVEKTAAALKAAGFRAAPYHAGLADTARKRNQDAFIQDRIDVIVATVAFGMGIDKSNVRYVIHAGMPKSLEHYLQETGRAGRDGLEADCLLLYSSADAMLWRRILESPNPLDEQELDPEIVEKGIASVNQMYDYCTQVTCRHAALLEHFGQSLDRTNCGACDVCLEEIDLVEEPLITGQKILSCVLRLDQSFGADYTSKVLSGAKEEKILQRGHDRLSTYALLEQDGYRATRDWIEQLIAQGFICKAGEYQVLNVTSKGRELLRGDVIPKLIKPAMKQSKSRSRFSKKDKYIRVDDSTKADFDKKLFNYLRTLRKQIAAESGVPAYIVFGDAALQDMARRVPTTLEEFAEVKGVGTKKLSDFGAQFLEAIDWFTNQKSLMEAEE